MWCLCRVGARSLESMESLRFATKTNNRSRYFHRSPARQDTWGAYLDTCKALYKHFVTVGKNSVTKKLQVLSDVYEIKSTKGGFDGTLHAALDYLFSR